MNQKVGRNDPCPCGSGKKYKNCCMLKEKESTAAKHTASGKRKFKATVLSSSGKNISFFSQSTAAPAAPAKSETLERFKFRMTNKDFRKKEEEQKETLPFPIPSSEESTEKPEEGKTDLPKEGEEFKPTKEDFRKK